MPIAAGNVLRDTVRLALQASSVAVAADVAAATWAAEPEAGGRVFDGDGRMLLYRNRGRLPFVEFWLVSHDAHQLSYTGGTLDSAVILRAHVGGRDIATAEALAREILAQGVSAIRDLPEGGYACLGGESWDAFKPGPWGHALDVRVTVRQAYGRNDVAAPPVVIQRGDPAPGLAGEDSTFTGQNVGTGNLVPGMPVALVSTGVRKAWATDDTLPAAALAGAIVIPGEAGDMVTDGLVSQDDWSAVTEDGSALLEQGETYYLSETLGKITTTPPSGSGKIVQALGLAVSGTEFDIEIQPPVLLA